MSPPGRSSSTMKRGIFSKQTPINLKMFLYVVWWKGEEPPEKENDGQKYEKKDHKNKIFEFWEEKQKKRRCVGKYHKKEERDTKKENRKRGNSIKSPFGFRF